MSLLLGFQPRTHDTRATDNCDGLSVACVPSLLTPVCSRFSDTNSASTPTIEPRVGTSACVRGVNGLEAGARLLREVLVSSDSTVIGLLTENKRNYFNQTFLDRAHNGI